MVEFRAQVDEYSNSVDLMGLFKLNWMNICGIIIILRFAMLCGTDYITLYFGIFFGFVLRDYVPFSRNLKIPLRDLLEIL